MENKGYLKFVWLFGYVAFAAVSCWATQESLHMLLSSWPAVMCWVVTVGFFVIASLGTKMIVDSFNRNIYVENRVGKLVGGIVIVLVFWLICSMPTNTHTFFYRNIIDGVVTSDITTTRDYLGQIENNTKNKDQAERKVNEFKNKVDLKLGELEAEIKNEANPGFGPKSEEILRDFASLLDVPKMEPLTYKSTSKQQREILCDAYRSKIYMLRDDRIRNIRTDVMSPSPKTIAEAKTADENLKEVEEYIENGKQVKKNKKLKGTMPYIDLNNAEDINGQVCAKLNTGYNIIKMDTIFVNFASEADRAKYTADNPVTKVKRLLSVFDVWRDYLKHEYKDNSFIFWILVSILVDIAAFVFFDMAFRKTEDY